MSERGLCVLHVTAKPDLEGLLALLRTTQAIAALGVDQVLLALEDRGSSSPAWTSSLALEVRPLRCAGFSWTRRVRALQLEFLRLFRERPPYAIHLHGLMPCLLGSSALRGAIPGARVLCSPQPTGFGPPWVAGLLGRLLQSHLSTFHYAPLAATPAEAQVISRLLNRSAAVLQQPVSELFFAADRNENPDPNVLADGIGAEAVDSVARLCVLLNGRGARVPCSWLGTAAAGKRAQLEAASIRLLGAADDADRASALARAWLFVEMSRDDRCPVGVTQAMAAGVPCLVSDIPAHRALIHHGETGFICTSERDLFESVLLLLRDRTERKRIGEAARAEAMRRFTEQDFQRALLRAYGFSMDHSVIQAGVAVAN